MTPKGIPSWTIWALIGGGLLVFGLITLIVLTNRSANNDLVPAPEPLPASISAAPIVPVVSNNLVYGDLIFNWGSSALPNQIEMYYFNPGRYNSQKTTEISQNLGFDFQPAMIRNGSQTVYSWDESTLPKQLLSTPEEGSFAYYSQEVEGKNPFGQVDYVYVANKDQARNVAVKFLQDRGLYTSDLVVSVQDVRMYGQGGEPVEVTDPAIAERYRVTFRRQVDGFSLVGVNGGMLGVDVWMDMISNIQRVEYRSLDVIPTGDSRQLLDLAEITDRLRQGMGSVVLYNGSNFLDQAVATNFRSTTFTSAIVHYVADEKNGILNPIIAVTAQAIDAQNGQLVDLLIYLPALKQ